MGDLGGVPEMLLPTNSYLDSATPIVLVIDEVPLSQTESSNKRGNAWDVLKKYAGTVKDMPEDWAIEHDHYLYGTPKHSPQEPS